ncbi:MAG: TonB-dependent receptor [Bacteroidia bacterium]|nr:TonB-dependent receptor [Bacteroidia bacterium]
MGQKNNRASFILIITLLLSLNLGFCQTTAQEVPLQNILTHLQSKHNVLFNYAEDIIKKIKLIPPEEDSSLELALSYLQENTGLFFVAIGDFILIKEQEQSSKILCGFIRDKENLLPLSNATVQSRSSSTITNDEGFFQVEVDSENELITIRHLGFKTMSRPFQAFFTETCSDIYLLAQNQSLDEVVISNYLVRGLNKISNGSLQIDIENFEILPGLVEADVLQTIQAMPGIQSINETVSNINIRGGTHDENLILWDNIKMYQSGHFFGLISMYNPQITKKVTLIKNGSDVVYTDGVSGTIAMSSDQNLNLKFKGNIGVDLINANGFVDVPIGNNSSVQIAARKSISEFLKTPTYNNYFDRISQDSEVETGTTNVINSDKSFDFYDTSLRWLYKISDNDFLRFNFINVSNELLFNENAEVDNDPVSRRSSLTQNSIAGSIFYNRIWNDDWQTTFEIYETDYKLKAINVNILDEQRFLQENVVSETSAKAYTTYKLNENLQLKGGYHFVETEVTNLDDVDVPVFRLLVSEVVRTHGVFSQASYVTNDRSGHINAGFRYTYIDKFQKSIIEPRLSFTQEFLDDFTLEVQGEFKHQNTSQVINFQNDFLGIEKRRWQLSNDDSIPIIQSKQISAGLNYDADGLLVSVEGYFKNVDGITTQSQGFQNQYEFIKSSGNYEVLGVDLLLRKRVDRFNAWASYSYMDNTYNFESLPEKSFPSNFNITHALTLGTTYVFNNLKVGAGLNWHSGKPSTNLVQGNEIVNDELNYRPTNSSTLNDYLRVDISAIYDFQLSRNTKANIGVSIWNVLDKENIINSFYKIKNDNVSQTDQGSLGITPNAVIRIYFN